MCGGWDVEVGDDGGKGWVKDVSYISDLNRWGVRNSGSLDDEHGSRIRKEDLVSSVGQVDLVGKDRFEVGECRD